MKRSWDKLSASVLQSALMDSAQDDADRVRLLATATIESGAWLHALPNTSLGLRLDDASLRIAVGLRLGTAVCAAHQCQHCGEDVNNQGTHGLSCRRSEGRHHRHAAVNSTIKIAFETAKIPARLEPVSLSRSDGKRPDGATVMPWSHGQLLVWDATCPDTMAHSYRSLACSGAGKVAAAAEHRKLSKYAHLGQAYQFMPVAIETLGAYGPKTASFIKELGRRVAQESGDHQALSFLKQRLSTAIQRGNAASVLGTCL